MKRAIIAIGKWTLAGAAIGLALLYAGDYFLVRRKMANQQSGGAFGNVEFFNATALKNNKVEIFFDQPQTEVCLHSLFPHFGYRPCWYAKKQDIRMIGRDPLTPQNSSRNATAMKSSDGNGGRYMARIFM